MTSYDTAQWSPKRSTRDKLVDCCHGYLEEGEATVLEKQHQDETVTACHLRDQVASLQDQVDSLQDQVASLQDQLARRTGEIEEARSLVVKLYEETANAYPPLSDLNHNARLSLLVQMFFASQNNKIAELESRIQEGQSQEAKLQAGISRLCEQLEEAVEAGKALSEDRRELISLIITLTKQEQEEDELVEIEHTLCSKPQSPVAAHEQFPGCDNKRLAGLMEGVNNIKWQAGLSQKITAAVVARLTNWANDLTAKSAFAQAATEEKLSTTQSDLAKLMEQLAEVNANLDDSKREVEELQKKLNASEAEKLRPSAEDANEQFRLPTPPPAVSEADWRAATPDVSLVDAWSQGRTDEKTALRHTEDASSGTEPDENTPLLESFTEARSDVMLHTANADDFGPYTAVSGQTESVATRSPEEDQVVHPVIEPVLTAEASAPKLGVAPPSQETEVSLMTAPETAAELKSAISSLKAQLEQADVEHQVGVELLRGQLSAALDRLRGLQVVQSAYQTDLQQLKTVLALKTKQEEELNRTIASMNERVTELVGQVDGLRAECLAKDSEKTDVLIELEAMREAYRRVTADRKATILNEVSDSSEGQPGVTVETDETLPWNPCCVSAVSFIAAVAQGEPMQFNLIRDLAYSEACRVRLAGALVAAEQQVGELKALLESLQMEVELKHAEIADKNRQLILLDAETNIRMPTDEGTDLYPSSQEPGGDTRSSVSVEPPVGTNGKKPHTPDSLRPTAAAYK
ncbi:unnamed protein product, partial [Dibothriocephalus latus]